MISTLLNNNIFIEILLYIFKIFHDSSIVIKIYIFSILFIKKSCKKVPNYEVLIKKGSIQLVYPKDHH